MIKFFYSEYQARVARKLLSGDMEGMNEDRNLPSRDEGQRAALGDLRGKGKHHSVGPSRTGSARAGIALSPYH